MSAVHSRLNHQAKSLSLPPNIYLQMKSFNFLASTWPLWNLEVKKNESHRGWGKVLLRLKENSNHPRQSTILFLKRLIYYIKDCHALCLNLVRNMV